MKTITKMVFFGVVLTAPDAFAFEMMWTCYPDRPLDQLGCKEKQQPAPVHWEYPCVSYFIDRTTVAERFFPAIQRAFSTWNEVEGSAINLQFGGTTNQNETGYDCRDRGRRNVNVISFDEGWTRSGQIIALTTTTYHSTTGVIFDSDIAFNTRHYPLEVIQTPSITPEFIMDLQSVMTHEAGHFIGLDHSLPHSYVGDLDYTQATMYATTAYGDIGQRTLDIDDEEGAASLYPVERFQSVECPAVEPFRHYSHADFDGKHTACTRREARGCRCDSSESSPRTLLGGLAVLLALAWLRPRRIRGNP